MQSNVESFHLFPEISSEETTVLEMAVVWSDEGFDSLDPPTSI
jgi:hypothetical protein